MQRAVLAIPAVLFVACSDRPELPLAPEAADMAALAAATAPAVTPPKALRTDLLVSTDPVTVEPGSMVTPFC